MSLRADHAEIIAESAYVLVSDLSVVLIIGQGISINRLAGVPHPLWAPRKSAR